VLLIYLRWRIVQVLENEEVAKHNMSENAEIFVGKDAGLP
jgi:hypothetical protein